MARPKGTEKKGLKHLNEDQLERFFRSVRKSKNVRDDLMFSLTLFLGLRVSELQRIKVKDINLDGFQITIAGLKNGRTRTYDLEGKLWRKLLKWMREDRKKINPKGNNPFLFPSRLYHDEPITAQAIKFAFKKYAEEAGLDNGFSVHSLRHSCGILRAKNGDSPIIIQKWLRHRSVTSSQVYFEQVEFEKDDERAKETFNKYL